MYENCSKSRKNCGKSTKICDKSTKIWGNDVYFIGYYGQNLSDPSKDQDLNLHNNFNPSKGQDL